MSDNDNKLYRPKRKCSKNRSNSLNSQNAESSTDEAETVTMSELRKLQSTLRESLLASFGTLLDEKMEQFERNISSIIETKIHEVNVKINTLQIHADNMDERIKIIEDRDANHSNKCNTDFSTELARVKRLNDVIITGVPYTEGENLNEILTGVANIVKFNISPYTQMFRTKPKPNKNSSKFGSIIVKFSCEAERNLFLAACKKQSSELILSKLGTHFSSATRIGVFESLLAKDDLIRKKAKEMYKANRLQAVAVFNGFVNIKINENDKFIKISNIEQLQQLHFSGTDQSTSNNSNLRDAGVANSTNEASTNG